MLIFSCSVTFSDISDEFWIDVYIETEIQGEHLFEFLGVECAVGN